MERERLFLVSMQVISSGNADFFKSCSPDLNATVAKEGIKWVVPLSIKAPFWGGLFYSCSLLLFLGLLGTRERARASQCWNVRRHFKKLLSPQFTRFHSRVLFTVPLQQQKGSRNTTEMWKQQEKPCGILPTSLWRPLKKAFTVSHITSFFLALCSILVNLICKIDLVMSLPPDI